MLALQRGIDYFSTMSNPTEGVKHENPVIQELSTISTKKENVIRTAWPRIRFETIGGHPYWVVDLRPWSKKEYWATRGKAEKRAKQAAAMVEVHGTSALDLRGRELEWLMESEEDLKKRGKSLRDAVEHYRGHLEREAAVEASCTVAEGLNAWLAGRMEDRGRGLISKVTLDELGSRAKAFAAEFGKRRIESVTSIELEDWLKGIRGSARTRLNLRTKIGQFFNWAVSRGRCKENPMKRVKIEAPHGEVHTLTVEEVKDLLVACAVVATPYDGILAYVGACVYAGLRPGEAQQLRWEDFDWMTMQITVRAETSKTRQTRYVTIEQAMGKAINCILAAKMTGPIVDGTFREVWEGVRIHAGYALQGKPGKVWHPDVMRHTYGSMWLAVHNDRPRLAELMGNSVEVIRRHYRKAIAKEEAEKFWAL